MQKILTLGWSDFRNIFREQILYFMFVGAPLLQYAVLLWGVPWLIESYPVFADYKALMLVFLAQQVVSGIGFVIASILLDERDEGVLTALRVAPISENTFITYRLLLASGVSFVYGLILFSTTGLVQMNLVEIVLAALLLSLVTPLVTLSMATFSHNKVEGLAMYKGINLVLMLPAASFFIGNPWSWTMSIVPTFWTYWMADQIHVSGNYLPYLLGGVLVHALLLWFLIRLFKNRVLRA